MADLHFDSDDERFERLDLALSWVPNSQYDEVRKLAEYAYQDFVAERDRYKEALERLASTQTFTTALDLRHSTREAIAAELVARGKFARKALKE